MITDKEILLKVAQASHNDQVKFKAVLDEWIEREGLELDERTYKRFYVRVYTSHGWGYRWSRLLDADRQKDMAYYLERSLPKTKKSR